MNFQHNVSLEN